MEAERPLSEEDTIAIRGTIYRTGTIIENSIDLGQKSDIYRLELR